MDEFVSVVAIDRAIRSFSHHMEVVLPVNLERCICSNLRLVKLLHVLLLRN